MVTVEKDELSKKATILSTQKEKLEQAYLVSGLEHNKHERNNSIHNSDFV